MRRSRVGWTSSTTPLRACCSCDAGPPTAVARIRPTAQQFSAALSCCRRGQLTHPSLPSARMLELCGAETRYISDCGVAGLHRVLGELETIRAADVLVCVAGMDCALPSVVAGLVEAPVVAVPTSVGYGAAFGGAAALLSALNACAPGVSVVNIDNGMCALLLHKHPSSPPRPTPCAHIHATRITPHCSTGRTPRGIRPPICTWPLACQPTVSAAPWPAIAPRLPRRVPARPRHSGVHTDGCSARLACRVWRSDGSCEDATTSHRHREAVCPIAGSHDSRFQVIHSWAVHTRHSPPSSTLLMSVMETKPVPCAFPPRGPRPDTASSADPCSHAHAHPGDAGAHKGRGGEMRASARVLSARAACTCGSVEAPRPRRAVRPSN